MSTIDKYKKIKDLANKIQKDKKSVDYEEAYKIYIDYCINIDSPSYSYNNASYCEIVKKYIEWNDLDEDIFNVYDDGENLVVEGNGETYKFNSPVQGSPLGEEFGFRTPNNSPEKILVYSPENKTPYLYTGETPNKLRPSYNSQY